MENDQKILSEKIKEQILDLSNLERFHLFWMLHDLDMELNNVFSNEIELWEICKKIFRNEISDKNISEEEVTQILVFLERGIITKKLNLEDGRNIVQYLYTHTVNPDKAIIQINNMIVNITTGFKIQTENSLQITLKLIHYFGIPTENFEELVESVLNAYPELKKDIDPLRSAPISTCQKYPEYIPETAENMNYDYLISLIQPWLNNSLLNEITKQKIDRFNDYFNKIEYSSNEEFLSSLTEERKKNNITKIPFTFLSSIKPHIHSLTPVSVRTEDLTSSIPPENLSSYIEKLAYSISPGFNQQTKITFLGGAQIGTMGILISTPRSTLLVDYGLSVANYQIPEWNEALPFVDAILLTHAHLDHSGAIPYLLSQGFSGNIFGSSMTNQLTTILLSDSQKLLKDNFSKTVNQYDYRFKALIQESYIYQMQDRYIPLKSGKEYHITPDITIKPYNACHIQGSFAYQIFIGDKNILFTGDINLDPNELFQNKIPQIPLDSDVTILDSTYLGQSDFNPSERDKLLYQTIHESERTIIPAFSVGRAQELLLKLEKQGITRDKKVVSLGMASKVARLSGIETKGYLSDFLTDPFQNEVIITGGGMLNGGYARKLVEDTKDDPKTSIVLCGYLAPNTLGYRLLKQMEPAYKQNIVYTRFSGHSSNKTLNKMIKKLKGTKVLVHIGELSKDPFTLQDVSFREKYSSDEVLIPNYGSSIAVE